MSFHLKFFKSCLPQILLRPFLNTLPRIFLRIFFFKALARHKSVDHLRASQPHLKLNDGVYHTKTHSRDQHTSMHIRALPKTITELSVLGTTMLKKIVVTASISGMEFDFEVTKLNATVLKESKKTIIENFTST